MAEETRENKQSIAESAQTEGLAPPDAVAAARVQTALQAAAPAFVMTPQQAAAGAAAAGTPLPVPGAGAPQSRPYYYAAGYAPPPQNAPLPYYPAGTGYAAPPYGGHPMAPYMAPAYHPYGYGAPAPYHANTPAGAPQPAPRRKRTGKELAAGLLFLIPGALGMLFFLVCFAIAAWQVISGYDRSSINVVLPFLALTAYFALPLVAGIRCLAGKGKVWSLAALAPVTFTAVLAAVEAYHYGDMILLGICGGMFAVFFIASLLRWLPSKKKP